MTDAPGDWLQCWGCGEVTASPYRVSPETGRALVAGGYCPACYEDGCRRAARDAAMPLESRENARNGRRL